MPSETEVSSASVWEAMPVDKDGMFIFLKARDEKGAICRALEVAQTYGRVRIYQTHPASGIRHCVGVVDPDGTFLTRGTPSTTDHRRMYVFARSADGIELACDESLDEGDAIIRARFGPTLGSDGTEFFAQISPFEAELIADCFSRPTDNTYCDDDDAARIVSRMKRVSRYYESGKPGRRSEMKTVVTYRFDISELDEAERARFDGHVTAQTERLKGDDGYPDVPIISVETNDIIDAGQVRDEIYATLNGGLNPFDTVDTIEDDTIRVAIDGKAFLLHVIDVD